MMAINVGMCVCCTLRYREADGACGTSGVVLRVCPSLPAPPCSERALLLRWRDLLGESDPDIIIGYNIVNFDLPYLFQVGAVCMQACRGVRSLPAVPTALHCAAHEVLGMGTYLPLYGTASSREPADLQHCLPAGIIAVRTLPYVHRWVPM